jgi:hypothetical protein
MVNDLLEEDLLGGSSGLKFSVEVGEKEARIPRVFRRR